MLPELVGTRNFRRSRFIPIAVQYIDQFKRVIDTDSVFLMMIIGI